MINKNQQRIIDLQLSIREGEGRLVSKRQTGKSAIRKAIENAKIRIERLQRGLPEGEMIFRGGGWIYEYEETK